MRLCSLWNCREDSVRWNCLITAVFPEGAMRVHCQFEKRMDLLYFITFSLVENCKTHSQSQRETNTFDLCPPMMSSKTVENSTIILLDSKRHLFWLNMLYEMISVMSHLLLWLITEYLPGCGLCVSFLVHIGRCVQVSECLSVRAVVQAALTDWWQLVYPACTWMLSTSLPWISS